MNNNNEAQIFGMTLSSRQEVCCDVNILALRARFLIWIHSPSLSSVNIYKGVIMYRLIEPLKGSCLPSSLITMWLK